ncbi:hypothetical protein [Neoroseomonas lacus]|uniref:Uncharacterized protein n=1 Tax=Neoroseomonas lacus TaxID=287609 RepID=A0A917NQG5_9PROT|nr:hypothetical protein [Neoroseomonas lacus]GGJ19919.1 hypothetical protein GCM10011320_29000 [Neoroseomonas lacus]
MALFLLGQSARKSCPPDGPLLSGQAKCAHSGTRCASRYRAIVANDASLDAQHATHGAWREDAVLVVLYEQTIERQVPAFGSDRGTIPFEMLCTREGEIVDADIAAHDDEDSLAVANPVRNARGFSAALNCEIVGLPDRAIVACARQNPYGIAGSSDGCCLARLLESQSGTDVQFGSEGRHGNRLQHAANCARPNR